MSAYAVASTRMPGALVVLSLRPGKAPRLWQAHQLKPTCTEAMAGPGALLHAAPPWFPAAGLWRCSSFRIVPTGGPCVRGGSRAGAQRPGRRRRRGRRGGRACCRVGCWTCLPRWPAATPPPRQCAASCALSCSSSRTEPWSAGRCRPVTLGALMRVGMLPTPRCLKRQAPLS